MTVKTRKKSRGMVLTSGKNKIEIFKDEFT